MNGSGSFGNWITDEYGLPAYNYTCNQLINYNSKTFTSYGYSSDHFHQIGNDRLTATAHNGGYIQVFEGSRGFQWLTYRDEKKKKYGGGILLLQIGDNEKIYSDLYKSDSLDNFTNFERIFGIGYFQKKFNLNDLEITHNISTPFSDDPIIISEIEIVNRSESFTYKNLKVIDFWDINLKHILKSLIVSKNNRNKFGQTKFLNFIGKSLTFFQKLTRTDTESSRNRFDKKFKFDAFLNFKKNLIILKPYFRKKLKRKYHQPAKHNYYPKSIFLSMIKGEGFRLFFEQNQLIKDEYFIINWNINNQKQMNSFHKNIKNPVVAVSSELSINPKEKKKVVCIFGYEKKANIETLIQKYKKIIKNESILNYNAKEWKKSLICLSCENDNWLARESLWHSYYTRSACSIDEYFNTHKFPQGSIYLFGHGLDGAIRDYALFLNSIIFLNPPLAKEFLQYILALMTPNGTLPYSIHGFAQTFTRFVHTNPSDLHLFLIWGITLYLYLTRDFNFLLETIDFYPKNLMKQSTVLQRIYISLEFIFSKDIGEGKHGLIKVNDGDWSDGISLFSKNRRKFIKYGESNFNTTFSLYVFELILPILKEHNPSLADITIKKKEQYLKSVLKTWNGKWFYRAWDGSNNPIGDKSLFLEHHVWLLISEILEDNQAYSLIEEIYNRLDKESPIGQFILYPPQKVRYKLLPKGWDVNGGIWHAMNALLTWGYSKYDPAKAYNSLIKNSLYQHANVYPNLWYGIWSAPDSYIANYAENAGGAFYHLLTPMCDFPIMNLNAHACFLLSCIKIAGIEGDYSSITITPKIMDQQFSFKSPLLSISSNKTEFSLEYNPISCNGLIMKIQKPKWWNENSLVIFNDKNVTSNKNLVTFDGDKINILTKNTVESIKILLK